MTKIVIIGAGDVGSTLAYTLQISGLVEEIVLIDRETERACAEVMDMNHGLFFVPPVKIYVGDYKDCRDAAVIVITAGVRQQPNETRIALAARNAEVCRSITDQIMTQTNRAILIIATNPVDLMTKVVLEHCRLPRKQVFGTGTVLDSARFRYELSCLCSVDPRNVHAYVIGEHGDSQVLLWDHARIAGTPLAQFCLDVQQQQEDRIRKRIFDTVRNSAYHVIAAKGSTHYGIGLSLLRILNAIIRNENSLLTVSTALSGEYELSDVCLSAPCIVGRNGIKKIMEMPLTLQEKGDLHKSAQLLQDMEAIL